MIIEQIVYNTLSSNTPITNLVGSKIYPHQIPQLEALPAITFAINGKAATDPKQKQFNTTFLFGCYSLTFLEAATIEQALEDCLLNYSGSTEGTCVMNCKLMSKRSESIEVEGTDKPVYAFLTEIQILHN